MHHPYRANLMTASATRSRSDSETHHPTGMQTWVRLNSLHFGNGCSNRVKAECVSLRACTLDAPMPRSSNSSPAWELSALPSTYRFLLARFVASG